MGLPWQERTGSNLMTLPNREDLLVALEVVTKLIAHYGTYQGPRHVSLGNEGYVGLQLAQNVIEQAIAEEE